jgi:integrase
MPPLTAKAVEAAKPRRTAYKLADSDGLHLLVMPTGSRLWRLRYRQPGQARIDEDGTNRGRRESMVSLGKYPEVSLARAREKALAHRTQLADGITPPAAKRAAQAAQDNTFKSMAEEWLSVQRFAPKTRAKAEWTFQDLLYPFIGSRPVGELTAPEILDTLRRLEKRGKHETAHRTKSFVSRVMRYAIATGRADSDPARDLRDALKPIEVEHHASVKDPARVGELLRAIEGYHGRGQPSVEAALRLLPLVFVRPGELRAAEWSEFKLDGDAAEWRIPAGRMKMRQPHIVPLSSQAVAVLRDLHAFTGRGRYVFPGLRGDRPISDNTLNASLRRLGFTSDDMTAHGFRSMASTLLHEKGYAPDWIERQLAHKEPNAVREAYNAAQHLTERRRMMQEWADYLDTLKSAK